MLFNFNISHKSLYTSYRSSTTDISYTGSFNSRKIFPYFHIKRFMWKVSTVARINSTQFLRQSVSNLPIKRDYPGIIKPAFYKEPLCPGTNLKDVLQAEKNHLKLYKDGLVVGLFTSSPRNKDTGELYHFISKEKIDGTVCPMFNPDGSQNDEGQYLAIFKEPRLPNHPDLIGIKTAYHSYCDENEAIIVMLLKIHQRPNPHILLRTSKNDPMLFHENGQRDKDF
jgi:hypothetical protein